MTKLIVSIDPGVNGGIAWHDGEAFHAAKMPATDSDIVNLLLSLGATSDGDRQIFIEEPNLFMGRNIPASAIGKLQFNCGICIGAAIALGYTVHRVRPGIWMKTHPVGTKKQCASNTVWKNKLKSRAQELYPTLDVTLATADALLLLDSARRGAVN